MYYKFNLKVYTQYLLFSYKIIIPKHQVYLEYLGENQRDSILRNVVCVSRGAKSVGKDNICRKAQYVSERAKCVGKDNICRYSLARKCGAKSVGKHNMCRKGQNVSEKKN